MAYNNLNPYSVAELYQDEKTGKLYTYEFYVQTVTLTETNPLAAGDTISFENVQFQPNYGELCGVNVTYVGGGLTPEQLLLEFAVSLKNMNNPVAALFYLTNAATPMSDRFAPVPVMETRNNNLTVRLTLRAPYVPAPPTNDIVQFNLLLRRRLYLEQMVVDSILHLPKAKAE